MSIVYIAGKMTGLPDKGRARFREVEAVLKADGHTVLNPAVLPDTLPASAYMPICLAMIDAADTLLLLDNWKDSPGAKLERRYAKYQKKRPAEDPTLLALGVMMCTLSEEYGFGYQRLCHLARETMENIHDVYGAGSKEDVELACEHVRQRRKGHLQRHRRGHNRRDPKGCCAAAESGDQAPGAAQTIQDLPGDRTARGPVPDPH